MASSDYRLIRRIRSRNLTYLSEQKLQTLSRTCRAIERRHLPGLFIEAGCALGGSTILIAKRKRRERRFLVYDVFGMIPAPSHNDTPDVHERYSAILEGRSKGIGGDKYYGYRRNLLAEVRENLRRFGVELGTDSVELIGGLVQDTLLVDEPVALAHIDVDWYDPVFTCLERIFPVLVVGGSMLLDDYHSWGGCRKAVEEFLLSIPDQYTLDDTGGSMRITKVANPMKAPRSAAQDPS